MRVVHSVAELHSELGERFAKRESLALVPTMGNLHAGHASLANTARRLAENVVVSVFVNPLQFGPQDDFERYPRTLDADAARMESAGVDVLFAPSVREVYPAGFPPATTVQVGGLLDAVLEGEFRRGHFQGVATVVNILFNLVRPDVAVFGEKDYQQLAVIRRMVADLGSPVRVVGAPTVREMDGLALSSRNQYLNAEERELAPQLYHSLVSIQQCLHSGDRDFHSLGELERRRLMALGFLPQYIEVRSVDLGPPLADARSFVIVVAAKLGQTRLIDNLVVRLPE